MKEFQILYMEYKLKLKTKVATQNGHIRVDVTLLCIKVHSKLKKKYLQLSVYRCLIMVVSHMYMLSLFAV